MVTLGEIAAAEKSSISKPYGSAIMRTDYQPSGVPVVRGVNLSQGRFFDDGFVYISGELADRMPGASLKPGDLVLTHRGNVGQVSMIPRSPRYDRYVLSTSQVKARLDPARALPEFYFYYLQSPIGQRTLLRNVSTVGVPGLARPVETVKALSVPLPPLREQEEMVRVLGAFDDLVEGNDRLILILVSLAENLALSGVDGMERPLGELADVVRGTSYKSSDFTTDDGTVSIGMGAASSSGLIKRSKTRLLGRAVAERHRVEPFDLVLANVDLTWDLGILGWPMLVPSGWDRPVAITSDMYALRFSESQRSTSISVWAQLRTAKARQWVRGRAKGTTVASISPADLLAFPVLTPTDTKVSAVGEAALAMAWSLEDENDQLRRARDELLLLLMTGKVAIQGVAA